MAWLPPMMEHERNQGYQDAQDGQERSAPLFGLGTYDYGYDQGEYDREYPDTSYDPMEFPSAKAILVTCAIIVAVCAAVWLLVLL